MILIENLRERYSEVDSHLDQLAVIKEYASSGEIVTISANGMSYNISSEVILNMYWGVIADLESEHSSLWIQIKEYE